MLPCHLVFYERIHILVKDLTNSHTKVYSHWKYKGSHNWAPIDMLLTYDVMYFFAWTCDWFIFMLLLDVKCILRNKQQLFSCWRHFRTVSGLGSVLDRPGLRSSSRTGICSGIWDLPSTETAAPLVAIYQLMRAHALWAWLGPLWGQPLVRSPPCKMKCMLSFYLP